MARKDRTRRPPGQGEPRRALTSWIGAAVSFAVLCIALAYRLLLPADDQNDLCTQPRVWLQPDFLSADEVEQLLAESAGVGSECWDEVSDTQQTAMLDSCPRLSGSALMQAIDRRVSAALGVELAHLEHGYLQQYAPNYTAHNLHLDQSELFVPARVASAIIFLEDQPVGSGHTIFPFAAGCRDAYEAPHVAALGRTALREARELRGRRFLEALWAEWNPRLRAGRITRRYFKPRGYGADLFALGQAHCRAGLGVRPRRGAAAFFESRGADGLETIAAVHGSCDVAADAPTKRVLAKFACDGPIR